MSNKKQMWMLGIGGTAEDGVYMRQYHCTEYQMKKEMIRLIKEAIDNEDGDYDYGDTSIDSIATRSNGSLYAYIVFHDYHIDYEATPMELINTNRKEL